MNRDHILNELRYAAQTGNLKKVQKIIKGGYAVDTRDVFNDTVLMHASAGNHIDVMKYLIDQGADVNAVGDGGLSPILHASVLRIRMNAIKYLIKRGANINAKDMTGMTVLMYVSEAGFLNFTKYLVEHGADITATKKGRTAADLALANGHPKVFKYLNRLAKAKATDKAYYIGSKYKLPKDLARYIGSFEGYREPRSPTKLKLKEQAVSNRISLTRVVNGKRVYKTDCMLRKEIMHKELTRGKNKRKRST